MKHDNALLITWTESSWAHKNIQTMNHEFINQGFVIRPWRVREFSSVTLGMPVILYKQKNNARGIFGIGFINGAMSKPSLTQKKRKRPFRNFDILFTLFSDPLSKKGPLLNDKNCSFLENVKGLRFSGKVIDIKVFQQAWKIISNNIEEIQNLDNNIPCVRKIWKYDESINQEKRVLGFHGELQVLNMEKTKLLKVNRQDLADKIQHVSLYDDGLGYDILSYEPNGDPMYIEVKTTTGNKKTPFFVTENEYKVSQKLKNQYYLYRLFNFPNEKMYCLQGSIEEQEKIKLNVSVYKATLV